MYALYDGVVSFFSFQLLLARMDLISFRRKKWAWGEVAAPPFPPAGVSPADSPWSILRAHDKTIKKQKPIQGRKVLNLCTIFRLAKPAFFGYNGKLHWEGFYM